MPFSESISVILKRDYGFNVFTASPNQKDYEIYEQVKERLKRPDLPFQPFVDICYERRLSKHTYLIIEALCNKNDHGVFLKYLYSFYKASYFYKNMPPQRIKLYCENVDRTIILRKIKKFHFLKKQ
ncbi:hypothetical protein F6X86_06710 [Enterococcus durans]|uniref:Uncharacterized protein n=1 Tax=Enterococcus durans TaxID=53345 RepID=A0A5N0YXL8_9ENTE|nr:MULTISPECIES: hypothetical protein [Enterococcus]KAA9178923.1 hypothetical protein F6X86_06710 [Enterococcus durans]KAA9182325.1 hypothetical protein F6X85_13795 [Enterococcus durans]KAA9186662.1 hypothetical protein F6X90_06655 [Enterococcus durans]KAA9191467.1 hypothetical protein F6Y12_06540 [Enterococcus durans]KAA9193536.1 hypothetical protein F6X88_06695 [Enterococcus durans]